MSEMKITLEACRVNTGLTQKELADKLGVSMSTVSNWERGITEPSLSQLRIISELSTVPIGSIFVPGSSEKMN